MATNFIRSSAMSWSRREPTAGTPGASMDASPLPEMYGISSSSKCMGLFDDNKGGRSAAVSAALLAARTAARARRPPESRRDAGAAFWVTPFQTGDAAGIGGRRGRARGRWGFHRGGGAWFFFLYRAQV